MSTREVIVDTADAPSTGSVDPVEVVPEGNKLISINTLKDDMDEIVKAPVLERRVIPIEDRPDPVPLEKKGVVQVEEKVEKRHHRRRSPSVAESPMPRKMLDGQSAFQDALRDTIPRPEAAPTAAADGAEISVEPQKQQQEEAEEYEEADLPPVTEEYPEGVSPPSKPKRGRHDKREVDSDEEAPEEEEEEEKDGEKEEEVETPEEDEDVVKLRLIDQINGKMAEGYLPPQTPSLNMSIATLTKILEYQEAAAMEAFGIDLLGFGWVQIIELIVNINRKWDPAAKIFGPGKGLKLDGATELVQQNIKRYKSGFRYIWKKLGTKKLEQYSPLIGMGLITVELFKEAHMMNVRREMQQAAEADLRNPKTTAEAVRIQEMLNKSRNKRHPMPHPATTEEAQPTMRPVEEIEIPASDGEEERGGGGSKTAPSRSKPDDDTDDDDVVVEVTKGKKPTK